MNNLTLGSLFDGSGGFPLGAESLCGRLISSITPVWASEIEPFPIRVTTKRLPKMKHYGDISTINGGEIEPVDIITFGSPCTDMSVAGKRAGLGGSQSVLFYEAIRIIKEMRAKTNGRYPRFICWENVLGAFSSNKGEDFKAVLEAVARVKDETVSIPKPAKWARAGHVLGADYSIAWRTFDAQYWGVPQRRKRIYLVADFAGGCADKILFDTKSVPWHSSPSTKTWQSTANGFETGIGETGTNSLMFENHSQDTRYKEIDVAPTVSATYGTGGNNQPFIASAGFSTEHSAKSRSIGYEEECSPTLRAGVVPAAVTPKTLKIRSGCEGGGKGALIQENKSATLSCNNDQSVFVPQTFGICSDGSNSMKSPNPHSGIYKAETARTLDSGGGNPACNQGGIAVVESYALQGSMIGRKDQRDVGSTRFSPSLCLCKIWIASPPSQRQWVQRHAGFAQVNKEKSPTLTARDYKDVNVVAEPVYAIDRESFNCGQNFARNLGIAENGIASTLNAQGPSAVACEEASYTVRRLTPLECCRLQGFPDYWCENLGTENPTAEEIAFWSEVFETHRKIMGKSTKPKSEKQIIKWLQNPHSDSAEYKMWGNGVALPCVCFVLSGIMRAMENEGRN